ncbi:unnamed protein product [Urochloa humidicola]
MAPAPVLAPGDRGGDATSEPPDLAPTRATTSPAANHHRSNATRSAPTSSSPAPQARPRLKARRGGGAMPRGRTHARPGEALQEKLLSDFHATAVPGAIAPNTPTPLWATPFCGNARFTLSFVRRLLCYSLTAHSNSLEVVSEGVRVFRVLVSCPKVAVALVVRGPVCLGGSSMLLHLSRAAAEAAAELAGTEQDGVTATQQHALPASGVHSLRRLAQGDTRDLTAESEGNGKIPLDMAQPVSTTPDVLPPTETATCRAGSRPGDAPPVTPSFNVTHQPLPPYLRALLTPSKPQKTLPPRPTPITTSTGCFRCLATDHKVRDCRDPVRCRNCRGSCHRTSRCPMPIARVLTPIPRRRRPTVPNHSARAIVNAVPFSPRARSTVPPRPTSPPPPTPEHLHAVVAAAFNPMCLIPSSSSGEADFELPKKTAAGANAVETLKAGTALPRQPSRSQDKDKGKQMEAERAPAQPPAVVFPRSVDLHVVTSRGKAPVSTVTTSLPPSPGRRSPPSPASPPRAPPAVTNDIGVQAGPTAAAANVQWPDPSIDGLASDEEEIESGDFSSSAEDGKVSVGEPSDGSDMENWEGRTHSVEVWLPRGDVDAARRLAFADISPPEACTNAASFIRAALSTVAPLIPVELLPSSREVMLLRFASYVDREHVRTLSPINHDGAELKLERPEETSNRFFRSPDWLAYVSVVDYPPEHWKLPHIRNSFRGFCHVREVDPRCLTGFDYSPLRLVLEVCHRLDIPSEVWVDAAPSELGGCIAQIMPIRVWPRANQFTADGQYIPFFAPLPPPSTQAPEPPLGLAGQLPPPPQAPPQNNRFTYQPHHVYLLHLATLLACALCSTSSSAIAPPATHTELPNTPPPHVLDAITEEMPPPAPIVQKRQSTRLAALNTGKFVHSTAKAMQRKALQNSLAPCSAKLKGVVDKRNMLSRNKMPLSTSDLRKMVTAAGVSDAAAEEIGKVSEPGE